MLLELGFCRFDVYLSVDYPAIVEFAVEYFVRISLDKVHTLWITAITSQTQVVRWLKCAQFPA